MAVCEILVKVSVGNYTVCGIAMNGDPLHEDLELYAVPTGDGRIELVEEDWEGRETSLGKYRTIARLRNDARRRIDRRKLREGQYEKMRDAYLKEKEEQDHRDAAEIHALAEQGIDALWRRLERGDSLSYKVAEKILGMLGVVFNPENMTVWDGKPSPAPEGARPTPVPFDVELGSYLPRGATSLECVDIHGHGGPIILLSAETERRTHNQIRGGMRMYTIFSPPGGWVSVEDAGCKPVSYVFT